mmetsp:Transcript_29121/g.64654  ORF Transcript_29121/g.64654 Transcript_29121/m.64654 type:complete len:260 (+) Transcript_29121:648-1427(+)
MGWKHRKHRRRKQRRRRRRSGTAGGGWSVINVATCKRRVAYPSAPLWHVTYGGFSLFRTGLSLHKNNSFSSTIVFLTIVTVFTYHAHWCHWGEVVASLVCFKGGNRETRQDKLRRLRYCTVATLLQSVGLDYVRERELGPGVRVVNIAEYGVHLHLLLLHQSGEVCKHLVHLHDARVDLFYLHVSLVDYLLHDRVLIHGHELLHNNGVAHRAVHEQTLVRVLHIVHIRARAEHCRAECGSSSTLDTTGGRDALPHPRAA